MSGTERREQLIGVGRTIFAARGFEAATVEEIAAKAGVSKPVVYEHFGGKEGLYAVVVDREMGTLLGAVTTALSGGGTTRAVVESAAMALLDYIESSTDGFRILVRDSPAGQSTTKPAAAAASGVPRRSSAGSPSSNAAWRALQPANSAVDARQAERANRFARRRLGIYSWCRGRPL